MYMYRAFWVDSGTVALENLQIQNAEAQGGGGAGAAAVLFINQANAVVSITNDYFLNCSAAGGAGGGSGG